MGPGTSGDSREPRKTDCLSAPHTHPLPLPPVPRAPSLPQAKPPDSGPSRLLLGISAPHLLQACHPPRNKNHAECEVTQSRGPTSALAGRGAERVTSCPEPQSPRLHGGAERDRQPRRGRLRERARGSCGRGGTLGLPWASLPVSSPRALRPSGLAGAGARPTTPAPEWSGDAQTAQPGARRRHHRRGQWVASSAHCRSGGVAPLSASTGAGQGYLCITATMRPHCIPSRAANC